MSWIAKVDDGPMEKIGYLNGYFLFWSFLLIFSHKLTILRYLRQNQIH